MSSRPLVVLAACALLGAAEVRAGGVDALEKLNDGLEAWFNSRCAQLKQGRFDLGMPQPKLEGLAWVSACSMRALRLSPQPGGQVAAARLLWELDGRGPQGERRTLRGEADVELRRQGPGWRFTRWEDASRQVVERARPRFVEVAQEAGLVAPPRERPAHARELLAGGLTARDLDGDGRVDLVATQDNRAFVFFNRTPEGGPLSFQRQPLFAVPGGHLVTSAVAGDFDADGDVDLVLTRFPLGAPVLFRNEAGTLRQVGPLAVQGRFMAGTASDLDGDGHLDLALLPYWLADRVPDHVLETGNGDPLVLLRGDGKLGFTPWPGAPAFAARWTFAAVAADLLGQGRPQLYVANDFGSNDLHVFGPDGGVDNQAQALGLDDPGNGMSADVADVDNDGRLDVYVANMFSKAGTRVVAAAEAPGPVQARLTKFVRGNTLYLNRGGGRFEERGEALGVNRGLWAFGSLLVDLDDDGWLDVLVANGYYSHRDKKDL